MVDFAQTSYGRALFTHQIPEISRSLKAIAVALKNLEPTEIEPEAAYGKYEEISNEEKIELAEMTHDFNDWFERFAANTEIPIPDSMLSFIKDVARHAWNANK